MKYFQFIFLFLFYGLGYSQEISGIVIDSLNNESIPFAAITSNFDNNTITNEEGKFRIFKDGSFDKNDSLFISSIGFHSRSLPLSDNKFIRVLLSAKAIELNSVEVSNREKLSVDQILKKVKKNFTSLDLKKLFIFKVSKMLLKKNLFFLKKK